MVLPLCPNTRVLSKFKEVVISEVAQGFGSEPDFNRIADPKAKDKPDTDPIPNPGSEFVLHMSVI